MRTLKIFISSPSDVETERQLAKQVIDRLALLYGHRIKIDSVLWEREPLLASGHFQDALDPKNADVMVCIFWSRLGSPLPETFATPDGRVGVTGTEWEFLWGQKYFQEFGLPEMSMEKT